MDYLTVVMHVLVISISGLTAVLILVIGLIIKTRVSTISKYSLVKLVTELKEENTKIFTELNAMKEDLGSINKMVKEIE